ncbi:hypothetical protein LDI01_13430 [Lentilactobacillus diolivorans]|uniref:Transposase n=1 Tax=Lentilactobacillus diolivorans TaxID=179838 RepID=A0ABQ0XCQ2_9LACO|nr:hypothetical protein LDI01_13430 [Lentilactobacillus diolivorans]
MVSKNRFPVKRETVWDLILTMAIIYLILDDDNCENVFKATYINSSQVLNRL